MSSSSFSPLALCIQQSLEDEPLDNDGLAGQQGGSGDGDHAGAGRQDQATGRGEGQAGGVKEGFRGGGGGRRGGQEEASQSKCDEALEREREDEEDISVVVTSAN